MRKKRHYLLQLLIVVAAFTQCSFPGQKSEPDFKEIQSGFVTPSDSNTLWCYWYWIGDDISKDGITKDLEAMKEAGIGGAFIGNINPAKKDGKVAMLSEEWWEHMVHAVNEGKRIGVDIGSFNCPGWSQSGGPWIKPEMAMRHVRYSETKVQGGQKVEVELIQPEDEFQDLYVLAFPSIEAEERKTTNENATIKVTPGISGANRLLDNEESTYAEFSFNEPVYQVDIELNEPLKARSLTLIPGEEWIKATCEVQAGIEGEFKTIKTFRINRSKLTPNVGPYIYAPVVVRLPATEASEFRVVFNNEVKADGYSWMLKEVMISEAAAIENYADKTLGKMHPTPNPEWDSYIWDDQEPLKDDNLKLALENVIDISDKMDASGHLAWEVPGGDWTIQRYGLTPTGTKNSPAAPQGTGYEVDKANKELVQFHYDQFIGEFLKRIPEDSKPAFKYVIADSYEMGSQNWTDGFDAKFEAKYGYNPKKYLPVYSGRIVGSVEESNRFLWDMRRAVADDVAYEYVGGLREAANEDNLLLWLENYGHWGFPSEFLMYGGQSNLLGGEFWNEGLGEIECRAASSAGHIYGKPIISAEAFTASRKSFLRHPAMLKKRGDWSYTEGINHFVLHVYIHQPDDKRVPGVNAWFSTEFNRHNTWFKQGKPFFDYLRRCQHLLQQGNYSADVCYFIGENAPVMTGVQNPELPEGYSYDYINAEVILDRLSVKEGEFVLPDGIEYGLMILPPFKTMRPEILSRIEELVRQGGKIYGNAPEKSPSLQNYPGSDEQVKKLAGKMWGSNTEKVKRYGKGLILEGLSLQEALDELKMDKDVDLNGTENVLWTHRTMDGMDIYFLSNQHDEAVRFSPSFRLTGMKPQLWDAMSGEIRSLNEYTEKDGRISVPLKMEALQSWFLVFTNTNDNVEEGFEKNFPEYHQVLNIDSEWQVDFQNREIGPETPVKFESLTDWSVSDNEKIKYYSGTAIYKTSFELESIPAEGDLFIDLGNVEVMATVRLNGSDIGGTWIAPYRLKATGHLREGSNNIEIEVVNQWRNRLIKDKKLPEEERYTWHLVDDISEGEKPHSSGLMGPVTIQGAGIK